MNVDDALRERLVKVADGLIPAADRMPAPSEVGIGGAQLDAVLASRPDLAGDLRRALDNAGDVADPIAWVETLRDRDPLAYHALVTTIVAGYYMHAEVKRLLGYPGQIPEAVSADGYPDYVEEGLLERVYERGPIYRRTPRG